MGLLGLFTLAIGGMSMVSDHCVKERIECDAKERAIRNGIPFYSDTNGYYYYIPSGEKCLNVYDSKTNSYYLQSCRTKVNIFNITEWQNVQMRRDVIRETKRKAREQNSKYVSAPIEKCGMYGRSRYLFDVNTMEIISIFEDFFSCGKFKMANVKFVDGKINYLDEK